MTWSFPRSRGAMWILAIGAGILVISARFSSAVPQDAPAELLPAPLEGLTPAPAAIPHAQAEGDLRLAPVALPARGNLSRTPTSLSKPVEASASSKALARVEGPPAPGLRVTLNGQESQGRDLRYRWIQTRGPAVRLDNPSAPVTRFTVPAEIGPLGFLLVVAGATGSDTTEVTVPIEGLPRASENAALKADAGDDLLGLVGRQVTLNGVRSEPRGQLGYRWVQTGGPVVRFKIEDGYVFSFVPVVPGIYRFALVVAAGSEISTADEVSVTVGSGARTAASAGPATASVPAESPVATQEVARQALAGVRGGADSADSLAQIFEDTADRMDLYQSYSDAFSEMSRRLDEILPGESTRRAVWVERLFNPLTARTLEAMRAEGLDLRGPEGQAALLSAPQKAALAEQFRLMAEGFRTVSRAR